MKPSERRALEAQRRAQARAEAERRHDKIYSDTEKVSDADVHADGMPYKRREGFFQSHIRLITFIITSLLVLTVFSPIGLDIIISMQEDKVVNNKKDIDIETVYAIHDSLDVVEWMHFRNFNYIDRSYDHKGGTYYVREYPIKDSSMMVIKVGGPSLSDYPDYVQLIDYGSSRVINILKEDPREFIKSTEQETKE